MFLPHWRIWYLRFVQEVPRVEHVEGKHRYQDHASIQDVYVNPTVSRLNDRERKRPPTEVNLSADDPAVPAVCELYQTVDRPGGYVKYDSVHRRIHGRMRCKAYRMRMQVVMNVRPQMNNLILVSHSKR